MMTQYIEKFNTTDTITVSDNRVMFTWLDKTSVWLILFESSAHINNVQGVKARKVNLRLNIEVNINKYIDKLFKYGNTWSHCDISCWLDIISEIWMYVDYLGQRMHDFICYPI